MNNYTKHLVGVAGFRGYSGAELLNILERHPAVEPILLEHRSDVEDRPQALGRRPSHSIPATADAIHSEKIEVAMLATQPEVSLEFAPAILQKQTRVIDLSGGFRLKDAEVHSRWYKERHPRPDLLEQAVYGLPEFYRETIPSATLVANPGCYPTAANLALRPLIAAQVVDRTRGIVCDAKSGISGAGRKASLKTSFCETAENFSAYGSLDHRHVPEVLQNSNLGEREFTFTAHLLPVTRGILETIYLRTERIKQAVDLLSIYEEAYADEPFVRLYAPGKLPDIRSARGTNYCDIGFVFEAESQRLVIVSVIDNLIKGAAGQAVQNLNLLLGIPETEGLL